MTRRTIRQGLLILVASCGAFAVTVTIDGNDNGRTFQGLGVVSSNGTSELLYDYQEPYRSDMLDFMFKPKFGAGIQHIKVEMGGGENSTCGAEPSCAVVESEKTAPRNRGYEVWLLGEGKKRNPRLVTECLPWTIPAWCGGAFTQKSAEWFVSFAQLVKNVYGFNLDYVCAAKNEAGYDRNWIVNSLRPALNNAGFSGIRLSGPDQWEGMWTIFNQFDTDPTFRNTMDVISYHWTWDDRANAPTAKAKSSGKPLWCSEMHCYQRNYWDNALFFARGVNVNYIEDSVTNAQVWPGIDGGYEDVLFKGYGTLIADEPWSGHYTVNPLAWAYAHTTQFTEVGWKYLNHACGQITAGNKNGTYVTLRDPASGDWSMIIATEAAATFTVNITGGLSTGTISVWKSDANAQFIQQSSITPAGGSFTISLTANSIYTLSTTTGQQKGSRTVPPSGNFPFPYTDDFEQDTIGAMPRYFADQKGTFEIVARPDGGKCVKQVVPAEGGTWMYVWLPRPNTMFGGQEWKDYQFLADVFIGNGQVEIGGRWSDVTGAGYCFLVNKTGAWELRWRDKVLKNGTIAGFDASKWHTLRIRFQGSTIQAFADDIPLTTTAELSRDYGRCFISSSYDPNLFDNVQVLALNAVPAADRQPPVPRGGCRTVVRSYFAGRVIFTYSLPDKVRAEKLICNIQGQRIRGIPGQFASGGRTDQR